MPKVSNFECPECHAITGFYFKRLTNGLVECWRCKKMFKAINNADVKLEWKGTK